MVKVVAVTDPGFTGRIRRLAMTWMRTYVGAGTLDEARFKGKEMHRLYYAEMRRLVLEHKLGSSWEPLCGFLRKEAPVEEFPHVNKSVSLGALFEDVKKKAIRNPERSSALVGAEVAAV
ncbi:hypothetical protein WAI453_001786 [Rhynchosporium graminicola]